MALTITRFDKNRRHGYRVEDENGKLLAEDLYGITTVLGVLDKPGLPVWSAREAGKAIGGQVSAWVSDPQRTLVGLGALAAEAIRDGYQYAESLRDKAATKGVDTHALAEGVALAYAKGQPLTDASLIELAKLHEPIAPDALELTGRIRDWFLATKPEVISAERMAVCLHCGYGCTLDLECLIDGEPWVIDLKTSSGVYESMALQTVGQAHALYETTQAISGHRTWATEHKLGVLWANDKARGGCELVPFRHSSEEFEAFMAVLNLWRWQKAGEWNMRPKKARR